MSKRVTKQDLIDIITKQVKWWLNDECELPFYYRLDRDHILCIDEEWDYAEEISVSLKEETGDDRYPEDTLYEESIPKEYDEDGDGSELIEEIAETIIKKLGYPSYTDEDFIYVLQEAMLLCYKLCVGDISVDAQINLFDAVQDWAREFCESKDMSEPSEVRRKKLATFINKKLG